MWGGGCEVVAKRKKYRRIGPAMRRDHPRCAAAQDRENAPLALAMTRKVANSVFLFCTNSIRISQVKSTDRLSWGDETNSYPYPNEVLESTAEHVGG